MFSLKDVFEKVCTGICLLPLNFTEDKHRNCTIIDPLKIVNKTKNTGNPDGLMTKPFAIAFILIHDSIFIVTGVTIIVFLKGLRLSRPSYVIVLLIKNTSNVASLF
ncbi:hypothetical protein RCL_jg22412.t1 [Rhizophagus clarus]|uniref:Uncharacterized protein n=1 Tax=Rhizophagus clarus TaxID=94130 RepID=A0A8H3R883_9GLOM|nr:hypothetical protein RCL_jg22412.t1 [Rhizophagus clarus]